MNSTAAPFGIGMLIGVILFLMCLMLGWIGMLIGVILFLMCLLLGWIDKMTAEMSRWLS